MITTTLNVPEEVRKNVAEYFAKSNGLKSHELIAVGQTKDATPSNIYLVLAKRHNETWTVWTSWNENTQSLNCGHYDLTEQQATELFMDATSIYSQRPTENRLSEIASLCIDGLRQDDEEQALIFLRDEVELTEEECEYFGVDYDEMQEV